MNDYNQLIDNIYMLSQFKGIDSFLTSNLVRERKTSSTRAISCTFSDKHFESHELDTHNTDAGTDALVTRECRRAITDAGCIDGDYNGSLVINRYYAVCW